MSKYSRLAILVAVIVVVGGAIKIWSPKFSATSPSSTIKIAATGPTTGPITEYGEMVREGIRTAVEQINAAGGVLGKKLEVVVIDDGCEPKQGPVAANRVVNEKIKFVVGGACSGATIAAAPIYEDEHVVMITPSATAPALTDGKHYNFIFRTIGRDDQQGPAASQFIINKIKPKAIAILHDKQSYGQGIAVSVKNALTQAQVPIVMFEGINAGDNDYSAMITKLKSMKVDFVYYGGYYPEMGLLLRQAKEQDFHAVFMGPEGIGNPSITAIAGDAVEGMLLTLPADFSLNPANAALVKAFKDKKRNPSGAFQLTGYTAVQVLTEAMTATHSTDPEQVAAYLHAHRFNTPIGQVSWNKQGDLNNFLFNIYAWHKDGSHTRLQ